MATQVVMPQLGESVVEGKVSRWLKQEGDAVKQYEPILEVETDKVTTEVTAVAGGTLLQILVAEGLVVTAGTPLAVIGQPGEAIPVGAGPVPTQTGHAVAAPQMATIGAGLVSVQAAAPRISPVVAKIAAEYNVDVSQIRGTGEGGRVTKKDILAFVEGRSQVAGRKAAELPPWEQPGTGDLFKPTEEAYPPTPNAYGCSARSALTARHSAANSCCADATTCIGGR